MAFNTRTVFRASYFKSLEPYDPAWAKRPKSLWCRMIAYIYAVLTHWELAFLKGPFLGGRNYCRFNAYFTKAAIGVNVAKVGLVR